MGTRRPGDPDLLSWLPFALWLATGVVILALVAYGFSTG
jgi:hypothetical protein